MAVKNKGLGKGLDVLFGTSAEEKTPAGKTDNGKAEISVKIGLVEPNRNQPRKDFDQDALNELAESIRIHGVIQPILVVKKGAHYQIVAGERRWRAAKLAGLREVPVLVREYSDEDVTEVALIENIQRKDLNPIEEAEAYRRLIEEYGLTQEALAERISKSRVNITNSLRLLKLPDEVMMLVRDGRISTGHAKVLLGITDAGKMNALAKEVADNGLSVRELEKLVKTLEKAPKKNVRRKLPNKVAYDDAEQKLASRLGTRVKILRQGENKGKIEISFSSLDDFERITEHIR